MSYSLAFPLLNVSVRPRQHAHFPATWNENAVSTKLFIFNGIEKVTPLHFFHRRPPFSRLQYLKRHAKDVGASGRAQALSATAEGHWRTS